MKLSREKLFNSLLKQGTVFHTREFKFQNGKIGSKLLVFLSRDTNSRKLLFLLPTSKVWSYYTKFAHRPYILVKAGDSKIFNRDSILDLTKVTCGYRQRFQDNFCTGKLHYIGVVEKDILDTIFRYVKRLNTISNWMKEQILPDSHQQ